MSKDCKYIGISAHELYYKHKHILCDCTVRKSFLVLEHHQKQLNYHHSFQKPAFHFHQRLPLYDYLRGH